MRPPGAIAAEIAPAKVNLTLHVGGKRPDGYHNIESLVVFAHESDALRLTPGHALTLTADGPFVVQSGHTDDNLVLKAARLLAQNIPGLKTGHFDLTKNLPAAAGLGGGSSDAAAALRLLARVNDLAHDDELLSVAARATGADVPVCLDPRPRIMRGIGDTLSEPLMLPPLNAVLINPGIATATKDVFNAFDAMNEKKSVAPIATSYAEKLNEGDLITWLNTQANDLEPAAISLHPVIGEVLATLRTMSGCKLARMSGSGATCFGLFSAVDAADAARTLQGSHPDWWVCATIFSENIDANSNA